MRKNFKSKIVKETTPEIQQIKASALIALFLEYGLCKDCNAFNRLKRPYCGACGGEIIPLTKSHVNKIQANITNKDKSLPVYEKSKDI